MAKSGGTQLSRRINKNDMAYAAGDIKSLLFISMASYMGWSHLLSPSKAYRLATMTLERIPSVTLFGLSPNEFRAIKQYLRDVGRQYKGWVSYTQYGDHPTSCAIITILPPSTH